jgi:hypothetical protein
VSGTPTGPSPRGLIGSSVGASPPGARGAGCLPHPGGSGSFAIDRWLLAAEPGDLVQLPAVFVTALGPQNPLKQVQRIRCGAWLRKKLASAAEDELQPWAA